MSLAPDGLPRAESIRIDGTVMAFSVGVVLVTAILAGLAPAVFSMRAELMSHLRAASAGVTAPGIRISGRQILVVTQIALGRDRAGRGRFIDPSFVRLQTVDLGLSADRLVLVELHVPPGRLADRRRHAAFLDQISGRLESAPAISAATPVNLRPFSVRVGMCHE